MITFITRALTSGFGAAIAIAVYMVVTGSITGRMADSQHLEYASLIFGGLFGVLLAVVHCRTTPNLLSSNATALFYTVCLSLLFRGTLPPLSLPVAAGLTAFTVMTGTCGYYVMRFYQHITK